MKNSTGKIFHRSRIAVQIFFVLLFFFLFFYTDSSATAFFYFDPLLTILNIIATGTIITIFLLSLATLFLTIIFGRSFCGWICPLGSINHFFSWMFSKLKKKSEPLDKRYLKVKYLILTGIIVSAIWGTHLGGWLDPFSLLTRSTAALSSPANYLLNQSVKAGAEGEGVISKGLKPVYDFTKKNILLDNPHASSQSIIIPGLFILLIVMNYFRRRFFCNTLCPLGALLGLFSRIGFFRIQATENCSSCAACSGNCTYNGNPDGGYMKSECLVCFNCTGDCPSEAIKLKLELPVKENRIKIDLGKRKLIGATVTGLIIAALPKTSIEAKSKAKHPFTRPPGSVGEKEFLEKCARCGNCVQSCPTGFIQPAFNETGIEGLWTPVLNAQAGSCTFNCNKCTLVCSTKAIRELTLKQKQIFKVGTAVVDKNRCYTYASGFNCSVCFDKCPTPEKAIRFHETEVWGFQGRNSVVKQIYVVPDLCIGCGICENVCPRKDAPGIINTSEDEVRESVTGDVY